VQEHFNTLRRGGDKVKLSKVVWHVIKSWNKVSGWGVSHHHHYCCSFSLTDKEFSV
jgi:hypothetical protein